MKYGELNLGQIEALVNKLGGMDGVRRFLSGELVVKAEELEFLLELIEVITLPATAEKFVASDKFVVNTRPDARVKICGLGSNFQNWFLNKFEEPIGKTTLRCQKLRKASRDIPIINELGGEDRAETTITEIYALLERQKSGEKGALLNNGCTNIFYVPDVNGILRAVNVSWGDWDDGWYVDADAVEDPHGWHDGYQVFSRNC